MALDRRLSRSLKAVDFYKKLHPDLVEATLSGAWISIVATVLMVLLLVLELSAFLSTQTVSEMVIDKSPADELLRVTFNLSFPALSCEFASVDISDALGKKKINLTKTIVKTPIDAALSKLAPGYEEPHRPAPKHDSEDMWWDHLDLSQPINHENFIATLGHYPVVVVNFYAPWCHWCQRLEPAWEAATKAVHEKYPEGTDGRIRFAKVDCTAEMDLCRAHFITGFPSIRVFRKSHDDVYVDGRHEHEAYAGDRTKEALTAFADSLVAGGGAEHLKAAPITSGCNVAGFLQVKRVPGTLHFTARSEAHSFDHDWMNMTHVVHGLHFGARPGPHKLRDLRRLHPLGLQRDWLDKLAGSVHFSESAATTHEHYLQVVRTTVRPLGSSRDLLSRQVDSHEYLARSHSYESDHQPTAKFTFEVSPIQVVVSEQPRRWYRFLTSTCGIIGGVFTVAGIVDSVLYAGLQSAKKKQELGKFG